MIAARITSNSVARTQQLSASVVSTVSTSAPQLRNFARACTATRALPGKRVWVLPRRAPATRSCAGRGADGQEEQKDQQQQQQEQIEEMDPQGRKTVEVVEVDVIEGEEGEPGSTTMGTLAGTAAGAVLAGGLAAAAAASAPLAVAAAAVGAIVGAVAGGAMGKEVPRGVDVDSAMDFDQPDVIKAGREQEEQDSLTEAVSGELEASRPGQKQQEERFHGRPTAGEHEIVDVQSSDRKE